MLDLLGQKSRVLSDILSSSVTKSSRRGKAVLEKRREAQRRVDT
jgi:hypothetical protein